MGSSYLVLLLLLLLLLPCIEPVEQRAGQRETHRRCTFLEGSPRCAAGRDDIGGCSPAPRRISGGRNYWNKPTGPDPRSAATWWPDVTLPTGGTASWWPDVTLPTGGTASWWPDVILHPGGPDVALYPGGPDVALYPGGPDVALYPGGPDVALYPGGPDVALTPWTH